MEMQIKVKVIDAGRKFLMLRWTDPATGQVKQKSAKTNKRSDAERQAGQLAAELNEGRYVAPVKMTWEAFRERFEAEKLPSLAPRTAECYAGCFNQIEKHSRPQRLAQVDTQAISGFQAKLRAANMRETTIAKHLRHLKAALRWAHDMGLLVKMPDIKMPKRAKHSKLMKGRPITTEEFERMLDKVAAVVGDKAAPSWRHFLEGLWWSGLRLGEALDLYWDRDDRTSVDFSGKRPMLRIVGEFEKGNKDRLLALAPEFAAFLNETPLDQRRGRVFKLQGMRQGSEALLLTWVSRLGARIGKAAGVKVSTDPRNGSIKYASFHDLRRSFGERWASRIMPQQLKEIMRHESIETTMRYYVGHDAERTADALWMAIPVFPACRESANTVPASHPSC